MIKGRDAICIGKELTSQLKEALGSFTQRLALGEGPCEGTILHVFFAIKNEFTKLAMWGFNVGSRLLTWGCTQLELPERYKEYAQPENPVAVLNTCCVLRMGVDRLQAKLLLAVQDPFKNLCLIPLRLVPKTDIFAYHLEGAPVWGYRRRGHQRTRE